PWLRDNPQELLFGPRQYREFEVKTGHASRPVTDWEKPHRKRRTYRDRYSLASYRRVIHRACERAGVQPWSPNRLRHSAATTIRPRFGIAAARNVLGHSAIKTTEIYAARDLDPARRIMGEVG